MNISPFTKGAIWNIYNSYQIFQQLENLGRHIYKKLFYVPQGKKIQINVSGELGYNSYLVVSTHDNQDFMTFVGILFGLQSVNGNRITPLLKQNNIEIIDGAKDIPLKLVYNIGPSQISFIPLGYNGTNLNIEVETID